MVIVVAVVVAVAAVAAAAASSSSSGNGVCASCLNGQPRKEVVTLRVWKFAGVY